MPSIKNIIFFGRLKVSDESSNKQTGTKKNWKEIAEVRMILYVVPVGLTLALIGFILSQITGR